MRAMLSPVVAALVAVAAFSAPVRADGPYVKRDQIDLVHILPPPPAAGSPEQAADVDAVLAAQAARTPETSERARADAEISIFRFADVIGPDFTPEKLPVTAAFFARVKSDTGDGVEPAKAFWNRPRPSVADPRVQPLLQLPKNASYPSGHTTWARLNAIVLAALVPEKAAAIFARADEYSDNRIVAGVHFPTDIAAGKAAGSVIAAKELENPAFATDFEAARAEIRTALKLSATQ